MPAATRIARGATAFNAATTPKTITTSGLLVGDLITLQLVTASNGATAMTFTPTATGITFTPRGTNVAGTSNDRCGLFMWTGVVTADGSPTISIARGTGDSATFWGAEATVWRDHGGVGNVITGSVTTAAAPTASLTMLGANSTIAGIIADWNAVATTTRTWRTIDSNTPTLANGQETLATQVSGQYTIWTAYWLSLTTGAKTIGMTAPTQRYSIGGIEVRGTAEFTDVWGISA